MGGSGGREGEGRRGLGVKEFYISPSCILLCCTRMVTLSFLYYIFMIVLHIYSLNFSCRLW